MKIAADHPAHLAYSTSNRHGEAKGLPACEAAQEEGKNTAPQLDLSKASTRYLKMLNNR
ncbi:MAG: hypothetical protein PVF65_03940 [Sphingomonadales bacterium]|jgi:hypothetical protein